MRDRLAVGQWIISIPSSPVGREQLIRIGDGPVAPSLDDDAIILPATATSSL